MQTLKILLILFITVTVSSCEEYEGTVTIKNEISNIEISNVYFYGETIAYSLLPGQKDSYTFYDTEDEFPKTSQVSFTMSANNKKVYLVTLNDYVLSAGSELIITLTDSTKVE